MEYKTVYKLIQFKEEFLMAQAKRQTELMMKIQEIDDQMERRALERQYRPLYITPLWPFLLIPLGALIGGIVGLLIVRALL